MRPILFHVGDFPVYSYSLMVVIAYVAGLAYAWARARRLGLDPINVIDISLFLFVGGFLGARLLYMIVEYQKFIARPDQIYKVWNGGLVFYGGLIGATLAALFYMRRKRLNIWLWCDLFAPVAMICLGIGRIGCYLNGCCYGHPAPDLPWGIVYPPDHNALGLAQVPVHPTPVYEMVATAAIFGLLVFLAPRKKYQGQVFWMMVLLYAIARFVIEFFRGDPRGAISGILSTSQFISLAGAGAAVAAMLYLRNRNRVQAAPRAAANPSDQSGAA